MRAEGERMEKTPAKEGRWAVLELKRRLEEVRAADQGTETKQKPNFIHAKAGYKCKLSTQSELNAILCRQQAYKLYILLQETKGFRATYSEITRSRF